MTTQRWFWPGILAIPAVGLAAQEALSFNAYYFDSSRLAEVRTAVGWALWVALPYLLVGLLMVVATRRNRLAWWLAIAAGVLVIALGLGFAVSAHLGSSDPLSGLNWVVAPVVQLVTGGAIGV
ncbi:MAG TPA: hypothetical protein VIT20_06785, partial [Propionibacteriaceae bacterium]